MRVMINSGHQVYSRFSQNKTTRTERINAPQFSCQTGAQIQPRIILVVDDEQDKREMITDYLEDIANLKVLTAKNLKEADDYIQKYQSYPLFRVYLDNQLGLGKTGAAFADELLQTNNATKKPTLRPDQIVMISADDKVDFAAQFPRVQDLVHCRKGPGFLHKLVQDIETITTAKT